MDNITKGLLGGGSIGGIEFLQAIPEVGDDTVSTVFKLVLQAAVAVGTLWGIFKRKKK